MAFDALSMILRAVCITKRSWITASASLLGLMSLLPAMLRAPMIDLAPQLPLRAEIRRALLGDCIPERGLLSWIERYELGIPLSCQAGDSP